MKHRKPLTPEEVQENANTYAEQVFKVLDKEKTEIRFNSEWLNELGSVGMIQLAARYTVARMLERDDFERRFREQPVDRDSRISLPAVPGLRLGGA